MMSVFSLLQFDLGQALVRIGTTTKSFGAWTSADVGSLCLACGCTVEQDKLQDASSSDQLGGE